MELDLLVTPGLGDTTYVLSVDGLAAVIDPQRDVGRALAVAEARGALIGFALETHVHNDYVSGAGELRAATGAQIVGPADAGYRFAYRGLREGDELDVGGLRLVAMATPGHTPEHTSYLLHDGDGGPIAVFSGGSLIVGGAGRTDLLGPDRTDELARAQFATMRRFAELADDVAVLPTHGAGSFCAAPPATSRRTSSIGEERGANAALGAEDPARFAREQARDLPAYPSYYEAMAPLNLEGARILGALEPPPALSPDDVAAAMANGAWLVDARHGAAFADAHVPGSIDVPLEDAFGTYVGWLLPFDAPVVLNVDEPHDAEEALVQLVRIGFDHVLGVLAGGVDAWAASGRPLASYPTVSIDGLAREIAEGRSGRVVDVRQGRELRGGRLDDAEHVFVADVPGEIERLGSDGPVTVICASGFRSAMAASFLDRSGVPVRLVPRSGVPRLLKLLER